MSGGPPRQPPDDSGRTSESGGTTRRRLSARTADGAGGRGPSPFYHRSPVDHREHFFGRHRELDALLERTAHASKPQCVSIVGMRRIGKSSLFRQLVQHFGPEESSPDRPTVYVYHDLEGSGSLTVERFFRTLARKVEKALRRSPHVDVGPPDEASADDAEEAFSERVEDLSDDGVRLVLCFDEFDTVTLNPNFDADLFGRLRYLTNSCQLAWVTSSFAELTELCHQDEVRQSPFFNVFTTVPLGLLDEAAARELLEVESARAGAPFLEEDLATCLELAGRHAFHLQQAGHALWEADGDAAKARQAFLYDAGPHFRHACEHLPRQALAALVALVREEQHPTPDTLRFLRRRGLVVEDGDTARAFSAAFADWLTRNADGLTVKSAPSGESEVPTSTTTRSVALALDETLDDTALPETTKPRTLVLDDRYHVRREIGRGGFGIVWEAHDARLDRIVAIKLLRAERTNAPRRDEYAKRFLREARAASRITHPNVIAVHDIRERGQDWYVVMEYFAGESLRGLLTRRRILPAREALDIARQCAEGLAAAHVHGIVHRDVKPENLLVDAEGRVKLVDFGLALFGEGDRITSSGHAMMTPKYSSPEQVRDRPVTERSDLFSLGGVLYEMLTGEAAFEGTTPSAVLLKIIGESGDPPRLGAHHPEPLRHLVGRCLQVDPDERWSSARELADEIRRIAASMN